MTVLIYNDKGAGPRSVRLLVKSLKALSIDRFYPLKKIDRHQLASEPWEKHAQLLIFPGGRDLPYKEALHGEPNAKIRKYVENGGSYLGICAGAYYGSGYVEFEKGYPLEVVQERELAFFPGIARGPAYGLNRFRYEDESGSVAAKLSWKGSQSLESPSVYFNGGCEFLNAEKYPNTTVLARYQDIENHPAAIIECEVNQGKALLSGVHPEYALKHIEQIPSIPKNVISQLKEKESIREQLFERLIGQILPIQGSKVRKYPENIKILEPS